MPPDPDDDADYGRQDEHGHDPDEESHRRPGTGDQADRPGEEPPDLDPGKVSPPGATASVLAVRARDGSVLVASDPDRCVAPASNTKLVTAALALERLGPEHRFATEYRTASPPADGVVDGDLVVRGAGAPDLTTGDLRGLAGAVAGDVDAVTGDLVCERAPFSGPQIGPGRVWSDQRHAYSPRSSALGLAGNVVTVTVAADGDGVTTTVEPETSAVEVHTDVTVARVDPDGSSGKTTDVGEEIEARTGHDDGVVRVTGRLSPGTTRDVSAPVRSPVRHCGLAARKALTAAGVTLEGTVRVVDGPTPGGECVRIAAVESAPLRELVRRMNVDSDNFVADQLARAVGLSATGEGSWDAWTETVAALFGDRGIETGRIRDGSGLSRYNRASARSLVELLSWAADRPWSEAFFGSLPGPGEGTLVDRLEGIPVVAKTGTLTGTRALSGRVGAGESAVYFAVLVDDLTVDAGTVRDRQERFVRALAELAGGDEP